MKFNIKSNLKSICYSFLAVTVIGISSQAFAQSTCLTNTERGSQDSTCVRSITFPQTSSSTSTVSFQSSSIKPFATPGQSCTTPWGTTVADNTDVPAFIQPTGTYNSATGEYAADCVEESRHCSNGTLSGSYQYQSCSMGPLNGGCGSANGVVYTYPTSGPPASQQCNPQYTYGGVPPTSDTAIPTVPASSGAWLSNDIYYWSCAGEFGGSTASCYAYRRVDAQCGSDNGQSVYYPNSLCNLGNPSGVSGGGSFNWACYGTNGGASVGCYANRKIDGNCGSDNGASLASAPTNLCSSGSASGVTGAGPWNWACYGSNGGTSNSCYANKSGPTYTPATGYYNVSSYGGCEGYGGRCGLKVQKIPFVGGPTTWTTPVDKIYGTDYSSRGFTSGFGTGLTYIWQDEFNAVYGGGSDPLADLIIQDAANKGVSCWIRTQPSWGGDWSGTTGIGFDIQCNYNIPNW